MALLTKTEMPLRPSREVYFYLSGFLVMCVLLLVVGLSAPGRPWLPATLCLGWAVLAGSLLTVRLAFLFRGTRAYRPTGRLIEAPVVAPGHRNAHLTGWVQVPARGHRVSASGHLWLSDHRLQIGLGEDVPPGLGGQALDAEPAAIIAVRPLRGVLGEQGLVVEPLAGWPYFFPRAHHRDHLLAVIEAAGFPVDWREQVIRL